METKNIILIAIVILIIALAAVGAFIYTNDNQTVDLISNNTNNTTKSNVTNDNPKVVMIDENGSTINDTVVGDNSPRNDTNTTNSTYRVYNPQTDSYVTVIGEGYDDEVDRWYTYDTDGVRYYNTRIK